MTETTLGTRRVKITPLSGLMGSMDEHKQHHNEDIGSVFPLSFSISKKWTRILGQRYSACDSRQRLRNDRKNAIYRKQLSRASYRPSKFWLLLSKCPKCRSVLPAHAGSISPAGALFIHLPGGPVCMCVCLYSIYIYMCVCVCH